MTCTILCLSKLHIVKLQDSKTLPDLKKEIVLFTVSLYLPVASGIITSHNIIYLYYTWVVLKSCLIL